MKDSSHVTSSGHFCGSWTLTDVYCSSGGEFLSSESGPQFSPLQPKQDNYDEIMPVKVRVTIFRVVQPLLQVTT
jgi:hypothetical protein